MRQWERHAAARPRRFVDRENDFDALPPFLAVDEWLAPFLDRVHKILNLLLMAEE